MSTLSSYHSNYLSCNNLNNLNKRPQNSTGNQTADYRPICNSRSYHNIYSSVYNHGNSTADSIYEPIYGSRSNYGNNLYSENSKKSTIALSSNCNNDDDSLDRPSNSKDYQQIINDSVNFYI